MADMKFALSWGIDGFIHLLLQKAFTDHFFSRCWDGNKERRNKDHIHFFGV